MFVEPPAGLGDTDIFARRPGARRLVLGAWANVNGGCGSNVGHAVVIPVLERANEVVQ
jgi:hypothetical protein